MERRNSRVAPAGLSSVVPDSAVSASPSSPPSPSASPLPHLTAQDGGMMLVCLIWGVNFSVTKMALEVIPALAFTAVRFTLASLLLWAIVRVTEGPVRVARGDLRRLVILGVVGNTLYQTAFVLGLVWTTATNSSLVLATVPTVVAVFGGLLGLERITRRMWLGIGLGT